MLFFRNLLLKNFNLNYFICKTLGLPFQLFLGSNNALVLINTMLAYFLFYKLSRLLMTEFVILFNCSEFSNLLEI